MYVGTTARGVSSGFESNALPSRPRNIMPLTYFAVKICVEESIRSKPLLNSE